MFRGTSQRACPERRIIANIRIFRESGSLGEGRRGRLCAPKRKFGQILGTVSLSLSLSFSLSVKHRDENRSETGLVNDSRVSMATTGAGRAAVRSYQII